MRNRYEFNIEDINSVIITTIDDQCSTICTRKENNDGTPSRLFVERFSAENDIDDDGNIGVICPRCGTWNYYDNSSYNYLKKTNSDFDHCADCPKNYEISYDEEDLISLIQSYLNKESFCKVDIYINGIHIH